MTMGTRERKILTKGEQNLASADRREVDKERLAQLYDRVEVTLRALMLATYGSEFAALEIIEFVVRRVRSQAETHNEVAELRVLLNEVR